MARNDDYNDDHTINNLQNHILRNRYHDDNRLRDDANIVSYDKRDTIHDGASNFLWHDHSYDVRLH